MQNWQVKKMSNRDWIIHDSHNPFYRSPFGAVPVRERVALSLTVDSENYVQEVLLHIWKSHGEGTTCSMTLLEEKGREKTYQARFSVPAEPCLLWYYFSVQINGRVYNYGNNHQRLGGQGVIEDDAPPAFQITVYRADCIAPQWYREGVVYQIFTERFFNGTKDGRVLNPKPGSLIHGDWYDDPIYVREPGSYSIYRWNFFGGNLEGIIQKLSYLKELGVSVLYLNPIFTAPSNHKYDTADYHQVDPMFGDNETFRLLCRQALEIGILIILDGVFSHTGSDSIYFNKEGTYPGLGAYQSTQSPYYSWYRFQEHPDNYESWWGIGTLPNVNEMDPSYQAFIMEGENCVINHWHNFGAKGWRLDVADELPDEFIRRLRRALKAIDPDSLLLGEVWEDASNKVSYARTREYLLGEGLDCVMNYPFRRILLDFFLGHKDAFQVHRYLMSLYENYPRPIFYANLNLIGSHDVPRALTLLGEAPHEECLNEVERGKYRLPEDRRKLALKRLQLLVLIQMTFPGVPCVYYGDEAGAEGYSDPYNRRTYPWGREDKELLQWYKKLIALRNNHGTLKRGEWIPLYAQGDVYSYLRRDGKDIMVTAVNRNPGAERHLALDLSPWRRGAWINLLSPDQEQIRGEGTIELVLGPLEGIVLGG